MSTIARLEATIAQRASSTADVSYTKKLLDKGSVYCAKKFGEEAVEVVIAAVGESDEKLVAECADAMYHLLVLLSTRGINFDAVEQALEKREGTSGLVEKAARKPD